MTTDIREYIESLKQSRKFGPQVVCHKKTAAIPPSFTKQWPVLSPDIISGLQKRSIHALFSHQAQAIEAIKSGQNVIVATPTASGKSMIYNLPVIDSILRQDNAHALYLFPLKALAQDQYKTLNQLASAFLGTDRSNIGAIFDGDTSAYKRKKIREQPPQVILTNPEMLHLSMLPYHESWSLFWSKLQYIVIDEVHSYRGVLGSHMAWVLKRLKRVAAHYGIRPQFILLSATIGNPAQLAHDLLGEDATVIANSGAPAAEKNMIFLNPWDSAAYTASQLLEAAVKRGLRTIVYTQSRKMTELINLWTKPRLGEFQNALSAYRAGFLPEERRDIEKQLFTGELRGVISTSALELGIDIGDLDLCILVGYPGSIMQTLQRGGRVGRGQQSSATILIAQEDALDQYFMRNPEDFFSRKPESAVVNPFNEAIMARHLVCAASEIPITEGETLLGNARIQATLTELTSEGQILETLSGGKWISPRKYPQREVNLRGGGRQMSIIDGESGEIIGEIDALRGMKECHPGAVYLHRATTYIIDHFDLLANEVIGRKSEPRYFTRATIDKQTEILEVLENKICFGAVVSYGRLRVTEKVTGYQKRNNATQKLIATQPLDLPEQLMETTGLWLEIPDQIVSEIEQEKRHFMGAIHALEHGMIALFPLLVLCDRNDIGGISCPMHEQTEQATIFVYDGYAGGVGLAHEAFSQIEELLGRALQTISSCGCENGCPSCVHSPKCGSGNRPIDKPASIILLQKLMAASPPVISGERIYVQDAMPSEKATGKKQAPSLFDPAPRGLDALPERYGVFDLETIRSADEVGGWNKAEKMGISVAVLFDSTLGDCVTYLEHEVDRLVEHMQQLELVVGFNNKRFDNRVLAGYTSKDLSKIPTLDLLEEVHGYLGYRLSLNSLAANTLGSEKSADGLQALQWYKEGRIDLIQKYCKKDVEITRDLFLFALTEGYLVFSNKARQKVRLPLALDKVISRELQKNKA